MNILFALITSFLSIVNGAIARAPYMLAVFSIDHENTGVAQAADRVDLEEAKAAEEAALVPTPPQPVPAVPDGKDGVSIVGLISLAPVDFAALVTLPGGGDPGSVQVRIGENSGSLEVQFLTEAVQEIAQGLARLPGATLTLTDFPIVLTLGPLSVQARISTHDAADVWQQAREIAAGQ